MIFGVIFLQTVSGGGGGGGGGGGLYSDIFHTFVGADNFFLVQNFEVQFFRVFQKINIFWV